MEEGKDEKEGDNKLMTVLRIRSIYCHLRNHTDQMPLEMFLFKKPVKEHFLLYHKPRNQNVVNFILIKLRPPKNQRPESRILNYSARKHQEMVLLQDNSLDHYRKVCNSLLIRANFHSQHVECKRGNQVILAS